MRLQYFALAAPILLSAAPPPDPEMRRDLRCFAVLSSLAESGREKGDPELADHANAAASFFLGRIMNRAPNLDIAQALAAEAAEFGDRPIDDFVPGCIDERMRHLESVTKGDREPTKSKN